MQKILCSLVIQNLSMQKNKKKINKCKRHNKMCENSAVQTAFNNHVALGFVINDEKSSLTSLGHTNIIDDGGFHASGVQLSKDGKVAAVGSHQKIITPNEPTNRPGLHIYLKKSTNGKGCCVQSEESYKHYQSIIFDDEQNLINVDSVVVSDDGSSIVAVGGDTQNKIYVFEQIDKCTSQTKWVLQQTLTNTNTNIKWTGIQLDDKHMVLFVRQFDFSVVQPNVNTSFEIYKRTRLQKKCSNFSQDPLAYKFTSENTLLPPIVDFDDLLSVSVPTFAVSHDGESIIVVETLQFADGFKNRIIQYDLYYDAEDNGCSYQTVSNFITTIADTNFTNALISNVHFGGPCEEKLYLLYSLEDPSPYLVQIYSRETPKCCSKKAANCCEKILEPFKSEHLITETSNSAPNFAYNVLIISNPFDATSFLIMEAVCLSNETNMVVKLWTQCKTDPTKWCITVIVDNQKSLGCVINNEFAALSQDKTCGNLCYAFNRNFTTIDVGAFKSVFVNDPNGFFYLNTTHNATTQELYFRVKGDTQYTLYNKEPRQALRYCSADRCTAKELELVLVNGPAPVDFVAHPELIIQKNSTPIQTCFTVFCYTNFVK